jgi:hypothetical protein
MNPDAQLGALDEGTLDLGLIRPFLTHTTFNVESMTGLGEGGEQNAPLGRAAIRGFLLTTAAALFFVPVVFSMLRHKAPAHGGRRLRPPSPPTHQEKVRAAREAPL